MVEHGPDQLRLLGVEHGLDLDHAVLEVAPADVAALLIDLRVRILIVPLHECVLAAQLLELRGGHQPRVVEQQRLVLRRRDAQQRADLRVRHLAAPQRIVDPRELGQLARDAHVIARRHQIPADAPGQPVRARRRALDMPATARIERAQIGEQPMHRGIEVCRLLGDPLAQLLQFAIHDDLLSSDSDIAPRPRLDAIGCIEGGCVIARREMSRNTYDW
jgi:hypothetical protein